MKDVEKNRNLLEASNLQKHNHHGRDVIHPLLDQPLRNPQLRLHTVWRHVYELFSYSARALLRSHARRLSPPSAWSANLCHLKLLAKKYKVSLWKKIKEKERAFLTRLFHSADFLPRILSARKFLLHRISKAKHWLDLLTSCSQTAEVSYPQRNSQTVSELFADCLWTVCCRPCSRAHEKFWNS